MKHPYQKYETSELWAVVKSSIEDLVENNDIELSTPLLISVEDIFLQI